MKAKEKELNFADKHLRHAVLSQLDYETQVVSTDIGVAVSDGVVTLSNPIVCTSEYNSSII